MNRKTKHGDYYGERMKKLEEKNKALSDSRENWGAIAIALGAFLDGKKI